MVDCIIFWKDHWYDLTTLERQEEIDINRKFDSIYQKGDIVEISSKILAYTKHPALRILRVNDRSYAQAQNYMNSWYRTFNATRTLNDIEGGRFEYSIEIIQTSVSGKELFQYAKEVIKKPDWLEILSKSPSIIEIGFDGTIERRNKFEEKAEEYLIFLTRLIAKRRYYFDPATLPTQIINKFNSINWEDWLVVYDWNQVQSYLKDKVIE